LIHPSHTNIDSSSYLGCRSPAPGPSMSARVSASTVGSQHSLPVYSPSPAVPGYSENPSPSEQRLDYIPRNHRLSPVSSWSKSYKGITVVLHAQDESASTPVYGRGGVIRGEISLKTTKSLLLVAIQVQYCPTRHVLLCSINPTIKIEGRTSVTIAEGGTSLKSLFLESHPLWSSAESSENCPNTIPFRFLFPSSMMDGDRAFPLPPSYSCMFPGVPGLSIRCFYSLTIVVRMKRKFGPWNKKKRWATNPIVFEVVLSFQFLRPDSPPPTDLSPNANLSGHAPILGHNLVAAGRMDANCQHDEDKDNFGASAYRMPCSRVSFSPRFTVSDPFVSAALHPKSQDICNLGHCPIFFTAAVLQCQPSSVPFSQLLETQCASSSLPRTCAQGQASCPGISVSTDPS
jgi:hypothetical protein